MPAVATNVLPYRTRKAQRNYTKPAVIADAVFFHKSQVAVGTVLRYMGRLQPNTLWTVVDIRSYDKKPGGDYKRVKTNLVRKLDDTLVMLNRETGEKHEATFGYASYSAIWRLN